MPSGKFSSGIVPNICDWLCNNLPCLSATLNLHNFHMVIDNIVKILL